jgi:beta-glucosidase
MSRDGGRWRAQRRLGRRAGGLLLCGLVCICPPAGIAAPSVAHPQQWPSARSAGLIDPSTEARIAELLKQMSLEEQVGQVIQTDIGVVTPEDLRRYPLGSILAGGDSGPHGDERAAPAAWLALARDFRAASIEHRPGHTPIPILFGIDAVHGHNNIVGAVIFPHNIGLGAAHDPPLLERIGAATAEEVTATGIDWAFAPTLAVPQDVRWGRSYEGYAQDPQLVARYATAIVVGLQGPSSLNGKLQAGHVAATAKHFLGDGGTAQGEDQGDDQISEEELIARHAQGYPAAINAGVLTVMASYSSWQGQKMHGNRALLTEMLKGRMGFEGFVVGDWNAHAQLPGCLPERCAAAFNAGVDMFMAPYAWKELYANTLAQVRSGEISRERLADAVRRILRVKMKLGLFESARPYEGRTELIGSSAHRALAREAVRKSLVLLKNDGVLPIRASARVLVTGPGAHDIGMQCGGWTISWQGTGNSNADFPHAESIYDGIRSALGAGGGTVVDDRPDVAVVVFGEQPYAEYSGDRKMAVDNLRAPLEQLRALRKQGIPVVAVFLSGRPLWSNPEINASNAFVAAWLPGTEGGGVADVLVGDASGRPRADFTGRLSFVWPATVFPAAPGPKGAAILFPLEYGLSYTHPAPVAHLSENPAR